MFGEERVHNSVDFLSRVLAFSLGQISALVHVIKSLREDFVQNCHTSTVARQHSFASLTTNSPFAATCCYRCWNVIERAVTHDSLVLFSRRTNTSSVLHALLAYVLVQ